MAEGDVELTRVPAAYRVTYRVTEGARTTTARLVVERPFSSRFETLSGEPPGDELVTARVARLGAFVQHAGTGARRQLAWPPGFAPGDIRTDLLLAGEAGAGRSRGVKEIADRRCAVRRFGAGLFTGEVVPEDDDGERYADTCIDADGLVLEEVEHGEDGIRSRWTATEVEVVDDEPDATFLVEDATPVAADQGGGSVRPVDPTSSSLGTFYELPAPPSGFTHVGRYAVVPPQSGSASDPTTRGTLIAGVADVWTNGAEALVLDQGGTLGQLPPFQAHPGATKADLAPTFEQRGEWFRVPAGAEVRVVIPPGRFVRLFGTMQPDELVTLARSLTPREGTGLRYLD